MSTVDFSLLSSFAPAEKVSKPKKLAIFDLPVAECAAKLKPEILKENKDGSFDVVVLMQHVRVPLVKDEDGYYVDKLSNVPVEQLDAVMELIRTSLDDGSFNDFIEYGQLELKNFGLRRKARSLQKKETLTADQQAIVDAYVAGDYASPERRPRTK